MPTATFTPIPTATSTPLPDLIFADGFESGSLAQWSSSVTNGGGLSVSTTAAIGGIFGMQSQITNNNPQYVQDDNPNGESHYRARFYFNPNSITMNNNNYHSIFIGYQGASTAVLRVDFRKSSSSYQLRAGLADNASTWQNTGWDNITNAAHYIELDWIAAAASGTANGSLTFWIDGVQQASLTGVANDTRRVDMVRLGSVTGIDSGTRGTYYLDSFVSRRLTYIGP